MVLHIRFSVVGTSDGGSFNGLVSPRRPPTAVDSHFLVSLLEILVKIFFTFFTTFNKKKCVLEAKHQFNR